jgi:hypothetical protein
MGTRAKWSRAWIGLAGGLAVAAGAGACSAREAQASGSTANAQDHCEVTVALGRQVLQWGKKAPDISQFPIFYRPEGGGFVEQCPWVKLGVTPLPPGKPDFNNFHYFTAPKYSRGGSYAEIHDITELKTPGRSAFVLENACFLKKARGHWRFDKCKEIAIT